MSDFCAEHHKEIEKHNNNYIKTVKALTALDTRMARQEVDTDRLFEATRGITSTMVANKEELKGEVSASKNALQANIIELKDLFVDKLNKNDKKILGLEIKTAMILCAAGVLYKLAPIILKLLTKYPR